MHPRGADKQMQRHLGIWRAAFKRKVEARTETGVGDDGGLEASAEGYKDTRIAGSIELEALVARPLARIFETPVRGKRCIFGQPGAARPAARTGGVAPVACFAVVLQPTAYKHTPNAHTVDSTLFTPCR